MRRRIDLQVLRKDATIYGRGPKSHMDVDGGYIAGRDGWVAPLDHTALATAFEIPWCETLTEAVMPGNVGTGNWFRWGMKTRGLAVDAQGMLLSASSYLQDIQKQGGDPNRMRKHLNRSLQDRCEQAAIAATDGRKAKNEAVAFVMKILAVPMAIIGLIIAIYLLPGAIDQVAQVVPSIQNAYSAGGGTAQGIPVEQRQPAISVPTPTQTPVPTVETETEAGEANNAGP